LIRLTSGPLVLELLEYTTATPVEVLSWGALKDASR